MQGCVLQELRIPGTGMEVLNLQKFRVRHECFTRACTRTRVFLQGHACTPGIVTPYDSMLWRWCVGLVVQG